MSKVDRQKLREHKENQICGMYQEKVIEHMKELLKGLNSEQGQRITKEVIFGTELRRKGKNIQEKKLTRFSIKKQFFE